MSVSYFDLTAPLFKKQLGGLKRVIEKARALVPATEGGEESLLKAAIAPDMFPFVRQIQIACDNAKGATSRLASVPIPVYPDDETSLDALEARIDKTIAYLDTFSREQFDNAEAVEVRLPYFEGKHMLGGEYLIQYALPNFFFHVATAYDIIRMKGGQLGKADYINGVPLRDDQ